MTKVDYDVFVFFSVYGKDMIFKGYGRIVKLMIWSVTSIIVRVKKKKI